VNKETISGKVKELLSFFTFISYFITYNGTTSFNIRSENHARTGANIRQSSYTTFNIRSVSRTRNN